MSKKRNKKRRENMWDITAEEQLKFAEEFHRYENGEVDIFSIGSGRTIPGFTDEGLPFDVINKMESVYGNSNSTTKTDISKQMDSYYNANYADKEKHTISYSDLANTEVSYPIRYSDVVTKMETTNEYPTITENVNDDSNHQSISIKGIFFDYLKDLGLMTINDVIGSRIHNLNNISAYCEMYPVESEMDASDTADIASQIYYLIISTTYPFCVMDRDRFEKEFSIFDTIDSTQYLFFQSGEYISVYYISPEEREKFFYIIEETLKEENVIPFYISLLTACDTVNNAYMHENTEFVRKWKEKTESNIETLMSKITSDETTTYAVGSYPKERSTKKRMRVINESKLRMRVYDFADEILPSKDEEEEDDENFVYEKDFLESSKQTDDEIIRAMEESLFKTPAVDPIDDGDESNDINDDLESIENTNSDTKFDRNTKFSYPRSNPMQIKPESNDNTDMTVSVMRRTNE